MDKPLAVNSVVVACRLLTALMVPLTPLMVKAMPLVVKLAPLMV